MRKGKKTINSLKNNISSSVIFMFAIGLFLFYLGNSIEKKAEKNEKIVSTGFSLSSGNKSTNTSYGFSGQSDEEKINSLLSKVEGVGTCQVMLSSDKLGVCIVCEGADDPEVTKEIRNIVMALFDIKPHRIMIVKLKGDSDV